MASKRRFVEKGIGILFADVSRAYFNAKVTRDVYIKLPKEDPRSSDPNVCGKLRVSMYGTRDAAQNLEREYGSKLVGWGFIKGKSSPCVYHHPQRKIQIYVHGDDFVAVGDRAQLNWFQGNLAAAYSIKSQLMSSCGEDTKQVRFLNRIISWKDNAIEYEADPRHAEIVMGLVNDSRSSPITGSKSNANRNSSRELSASECTQYRAAVARCNFLAIDRPDIQFAAKEVSRFLSSPRLCDWDNVYEIGRYLKRVPRLTHKFVVCGGANVVDVYVDSDWAGDCVTRKSTSGVVIMYDNQVVKTYSRNQKTLALSSGEAELYAIVSGTSEGLGVQSILKDFGVNASVRVHTDSSAAIGITKRYGSGRIRHLQTQFLWIQDLIYNSRVASHKVGGNSNPADLRTKYLGGESISSHLSRMHLSPSVVRPANAPTLSSFGGLRACNNNFLASAFSCVGVS